MRAFAPDPRLCGLPRQVFECYGKPHIGCRYEGRSVKSHALDDGALCACCGRAATNAHHWPPVSKGCVEVAGTVLRPALFAVCGSGTTGCHDGWHGGARYRALWAWDDPAYADEWLRGAMLGRMEPHSPELYLYGCWELYDLREGRIWRHREGA